MGINCKYNVVTAQYTYDFYIHNNRSSILRKYYDVTLAANNAVTYNLCSNLIESLFLTGFLLMFSQINLKMMHIQQIGSKNRSTEGCSKVKKSVDMTSSGKNGLNIRTNASPKWDRTRCPEE